MTIELARRALLKGVVASFMATLPLSLVGCGDDDASTSTTPPPDGGTTDNALPPVYEAYIPREQQDSARVIAQRYLAVVAPGASNDAIRALVAPTVAIAMADPDIAASVTALRAQVSSDFATGHAVNIDGWYFARTELQLCVLASIPEVAT